MSTQRPMHPTIEQFRRLVSRLQDGDHDQQWLGARLETYLRDAQRGATLEDVFGLSVRPGGSPWWKIEALETRDAAIVALSKEFDGDVTEQARQIAEMSRRYIAGTWRHDRDRAEMPVHYAGTRAMLYIAVRAAAGRIPGARRIRQIIAGS